MTKYLIKLKYIKPMKLLFEKEQKLAEFIPFLPIEGENKYVKGKIEGKARVFLPEFLDFARKLGFNIKGKVLEGENDENYLRLFVYAMVSQFVKSETERREIERTVMELPILALRYWASTFRNAYWEGGRKRVRRISKCFRVIYCD
ncbi:hypothetical protein A3L04_08495 [Thermococcus chitonophagus]|uniref:Uncharacterized protein n=1 Tax=Thermococcus chitonophagus TaxID=54262 RepID=A0A2Z2N6A7_9EURY|nr:hypothetical protein [Thermococcus chitonophagus]ASJ17104.1 hypothetical protein A3L04_08495 [Thermococcus chitonophagus]